MPTKILSFIPIGPSPHPRRKDVRGKTGKDRSSLLPHCNLRKSPASVFYGSLLSSWWSPDRQSGSNSFSCFTPGAFPSSAHAPSSWPFYTPTFPQHPSPVPASSLCACSSLHSEHLPPPLPACPTFTHPPRTHSGASSSWKHSLIALGATNCFLCLHITLHRAIIYGYVTASPNPRVLSQGMGEMPRWGHSLNGHPEACHLASTHQTWLEESMMKTQNNSHRNEQGQIPLWI